MPGTAPRSQKSFLLYEIVQPRTVGQELSCFPRQSDIRIGSPDEFGEHDSQNLQDSGEEERLEGDVCPYSHTKKILEMMLFLLYPAASGYRRDSKSPWPVVRPRAQPPGPDRGIAEQCHSGPDVADSGPHLEALNGVGCRSLPLCHAPFNSIRRPCHPRRTHPGFGVTPPRRPGLAPLGLALWPGLRRVGNGSCGQPG